MNSQRLPKPQFMLWILSMPHKPGAILSVPLRRCTDLSLHAAQIPGATSEGSGERVSADFPPMAAADAQRYRQIFQQMDADKDNYILVSR